MIQFLICSLKIIFAYIIFFPKISIIKFHFVLIIINILFTFLCFSVLLILINLFTTLTYFIQYYINHLYSLNLNFKFKHYL